VHADKKLQLADWRLRPLTAEMMAYARADTHYLLYIYDRLKAELAKEDLVLLMYSDDINTVGDVATFLENGDLLSEMELADGEDGQYRKLTEEEVKAIQHALLRFREERGGDVLAEFPTDWILSEPWDRKRFEIHWKATKGKARPPYYLWAYSQLAAAEYAEEYWPGKVKEVVEVEAIPDGARVENVPSDFGRSALKEAMS
jgi:hypothetical protein